MTEQHLSFWKKSWKGWANVWPWLILAGAIFVILLFISLVVPGGRAASGGWLGDLSALAAASLVAATVVFVGCEILRWLCWWGNVKRVLIALGCLAVMVALFYAEEDWRGRHAWNQFKRGWEARGEHFTLASYVPPPVPDDQNFAMTPIASTSYEQTLTRDGKVVPPARRDSNFVRRMQMFITLNGDSPTNAGGNRVKGTFTRLESWQAYYRELASHTNMFPVPAQPQSPAADVLLALSRYDSVLDELRAADRLPDSRFPLNYDCESPWAILLPHLAPLKSCAQVLQLRSVAELQNGQPDKALEDVRLALDLTGKVRSEPFLISHLVRTAMVHLALQPIWEGLAQHRWSDPQLAALDAELAKFDFVADYRLSLHGELGAHSDTAQLILHHPSELQGILSFDGNSPDPEAALIRLIPGGWIYQNEYYCARMMENGFFPVADAGLGTFSPSQARKADAQLAAETKRLSPFNCYERLLLPALSKASLKFAYAQASVDLARTAVALERYRLAHGEFPETLEPLAPQFIATLPHDVIGGKPLKYRRDPGGLFTLYSIGWNEQDDGGMVAFHKSARNDENRVAFANESPDNENGDWVWRYPATAN
jgi:hypothetical protein